MNNSEKKIVAFRTAIIAGIFSLIVGVVMLLNFWQLKTTDPLESEALKNLIVRLQEDTRNEELKVEIRNLDLMTRNAFFTNQWQIRSGAFLLIGGILTMVVGLRVYHSLSAQIKQPESMESQLDLELLISRRWILYTVSIIFGLALLASFLSIDHLSSTYALTESSDQEDAIPVQEITPIQDEATPMAKVVEPVAETSEVTIESAEPENTQNSEAEVPQVASEEKAPEKPVSKKSNSSIPNRSEIIKNFPAFRGPYGLGISYQKNIPVEWDGASGKNVLWKIPAPLPGFNSPVIWGNSLFISGADKSRQSVYCYDINTGKLNWDHKVSGIKRPAGKMEKPTDDTGYAAPTVATDGRYVYAIFATGDLVCVDLKGTRIWAKNMGIPENHYGHSSSLMLWKDLLFIQFDTNKAGKVMAVNALTGDTAWETNRSSKISWASPILTNLGNHFELVLASSPSVAGYDPVTGKELWSLECLSGEVGPSPAYYNGVVYAANEYANLVAIKPGNELSVIWETNEYLPEVASPVAMDGMLFLGTSYGVIACFDTTNGEILWEYECDQGIYSSPVIADGKVYFLDMDGIMHIFNADKTMKLIGEPALGEQAVSTPAFADGKIFLRGYENLYCIGK